MGLLNLWKEVGGDSMNFRLLKFGFQGLVFPYSAQDK